MNSTTRTQAGDDIPISLESFGCTMNHGEAERLADRLVEAGMRVVGSWKEAVACVIVTCVVIRTTENRMLRLIRERSEAGRPVIIAGCLATHPGLGDIDLPDPNIVIGPREYDNAAELVSDFLEEVLDRRTGSGREHPDHRATGTEDIGKRGGKDTGRKEDGTSEPPSMCCADTDPGSIVHRLSKGPIGILPISQGCLGACTYCITHFTRGALLSYDPEKLVEDTGLLLDRGSCEIQVTAQDTAAYGMDRVDGIRLPRLLERLSSLAPEQEFMLRVGMMRPDSLDHIREEMVRAMSDPRVYNFLHLPVQSGSDAVLNAMNRGYTVKEFEGLVAFLRDAIPDLTLSTDIIVGFPTETDEDMRMSMELIERLGPNILNITRYSPRPHTPAAKIRPLFHTRKARERSRALTLLQRGIALQENMKMVGEKVMAFTTEKGTGNTTLARMGNYRQVVVDGKVGAGQWVEIDIMNATGTYLIGER